MILWGILPVNWSYLLQAQAELAAEEGEPVQVDKKEAFSQLAKTLNKLLNKLETTEKGNHALY